MILRVLALPYRSKPVARVSQRTTSEWKINEFACAFSQVSRRQIRVFVLQFQSDVKFAPCSWKNVSKRWATRPDAERGVVERALAHRERAPGSAAPLLPASHTPSEQRSRLRLAPKPERTPPRRLPSRRVLLSRPRGEREVGRTVELIRRTSPGYISATIGHVDRMPLAPTVVSRSTSALRCTMRPEWIRLLERLADSARATRPWSASLVCASCAQPSRMWRSILEALPLVMRST